MRTTAVRSIDGEDGFTLVELMIASLVTLAIMGVAVNTFSNGLALKESALQLADAAQNLRGGSNLLVKDLLQVGRNLPRGGIAIPSGVGAEAVVRPTPISKPDTFDAAAVVISAITTGEGMGHAINGRQTDLITLLTEDDCLTPLLLNPSTTSGAVPKITATGASFGVGTNTAWLTGDGNDCAPLQAGDLIYFQATSNTLQTVTRVEGATVYFDANDPFKLNQPGAEAGSITQVLGPWQVTARRVFMYTYYVQQDSTGVPQLMRQVNHFPPQALAGVIEDLELSYDLVDGTFNPVNVTSLPYQANNVTYTENQIRKVNIHIGVRSEFRSPRSNDYLRNHVSTVVSLRNLAFVSRYE